MKVGAKVLAAGAVLSLQCGISPAQAHTGSATAYHRCDGSTTLQANGTRARWGEVANNWLPLGTWIRMVRPERVGGRRYFRVDDRGGGGFALDFYARSCGWMYQWGRRRVTFRVVPRGEAVRLRLDRSLRG